MLITFIPSEKRTARFPCSTTITAPADVLNVVAKGPVLLQKMNPSSHLAQSRCDISEMLRRDATRRFRIHLLACRDLHFHDFRRKSITRLDRSLPVLELDLAVWPSDFRMLQVFHNDSAVGMAAMLK